MQLNTLNSNLINSPNRQDLFDADKRENNLRIYSEALKVDVQFNKESNQAEIV